MALGLRRASLEALDRGDESAGEHNQLRNAHAAEAPSDDVLLKSEAELRKNQDNQQQKELEEEEEEEEEWQAAERSPTANVDELGARRQQALDQKSKFSNENQSLTSPLKSLTKLRALIQNEQVCRYICFTIVWVYDRLGPFYCMCNYSLKLRCTS